MAISKNFVVKNGLEVAIDSLVVDTDTRRVGIASTTPNTTLDVRGGIGATHLEVTGIATIATLSVTGFTATNGDFTNLTGTIGTITSLESTNGSITNLSGTIGTFSSTLNSYLVIATELSNTNGTITNLSGTISTITNMSGTIGTITNLVGTSGTITNITGTSGTITNLVGTSGTITNITGTSGTITNLTFTEGSGTNLNVTGITTLATADIASLTITGAAVTNLSVTNNFDVTGLSTFGGLVDINAGGQANSFIVEDLTDNRVVIAGAGGELEDDANLTFDGSTLTVGVGLDVDGHTELDDVNVSGTATITSLDVQSNFDVYDSQATFHNNVLINGNLTIGGTTATVYVDDLRVTDKDLILGFATDTSNNEISTDDTANHGGVAVASTEGNPLVNFTLTGINTLPDTYKQIMWVKADSYGVGTTDAWLFNYGVGIGSTLVPNGVRLAVSEIRFTDDTIDTPNTTITQDASVGRNFSVTGLSTFTGNIDANGGLTANQATVEDLTNDRIVIAGTGGRLEDSANLTFDGTTLNVVGQTDVDDLNVSGVSTFVGNIDANGDLDVDGHTELDNLNVSGFSTFVGFSTFSDYVFVQDGLNVGGITTSSAYTINGTQVISSGRELQNIASLDATTTATIESAIANAPNTFTDLRVSGVSTFIGLSTFAGGAEFLGVGATSTTLTVSGVSTFTGSSNNFSGDIDVDGHTELDNLNVSGVSTFAGTITASDANFSGNVTIGGTLTYEDVTNIDSVGIITARSGVRVTGGGLEVTGVSTFASNLDINASIDVDGHTELDNVNISGFSTFVGFATFSDYVYVQDGLNVTGTGATLTTLNVTGVSTLGGQSRLLGDLYVSGITTVGTSITMYPSTGIISATAYYGDGSNLSGVIGGVGLATESGTVGFGATILDFRGAGISTITISSGIGTINISGGGGSATGSDIIKQTFTVGSGGQSVFTLSSSYTSGYIDVYLNGVKLSPADFTESGASEITLVSAAVEDDVVDFVNYRTISLTTYAPQAGIATNLSGGYVDATQLTVTGVSTFSGNLNIGVGATVGFGSTAYFADNAKAIFGVGEDLQIYHDGTSSYIENTKVASNLFINSAFGLQLRVNSSEAALAATPNGSTSLFYNNSQKFETTSSGAVVTGICTASAFVDDGVDLLTEINTKASTGKAIAMAMVFG